MQSIRVLALATCYNRCEQTYRSLESLIKGNPNIKFSFIIVDDGSADGTKSMLESFDNVTIVEGNGSLFYSGGMRLAIAKAKTVEDRYDFCMLFNDDVDFYPHAIEKMVALTNSERRVIVGATCDSNGKLTYAGVNKLSKWIPKCEIVYNKERLITCDTFNANCVIIEHNVFLTLDNIDPVYIHGMGDYDYGFSATRKGIKLYVSNFFCGVCGETTEEGSWRDSSLTRKERFAIKNHAKGTPDKVWFHYLLKNYNILTAIVYSISPYIRILLGK